MRRPVRGARLLAGSGLGAAAAAAGPGALAAGTEGGAPQELSRSRQARAVRRIRGIVRAVP